MKQPADHETQQLLLKFGRQLAKYVERERRAGLSTEWADWAISAVADHLMHETDFVEAVEQSLGLTKSRGRPVEEQNLTWALNAHPHVPKRGRANWKGIARAVNYPGTASNLRKIYTEHFDEMKFAVREIEKSLS